MSAGCPASRTETALRLASVQLKLLCVFYDALRSEARRKEKEKAKAGTSSGGGGGGRGDLKSSGSGGQRPEGGVSVSTLKRAAAQPLSQASAKVGCLCLPAYVPRLNRAPFAQWQGMNYGFLWWLPWCLLRWWWLLQRVVKRSGAAAGASHQAHGSQRPKGMLAGLRKRPAG